MDVREKLVELLKGSKLCSKRFDDQYSDRTIAVIADHLIAHGVTVQEWIPAAEPPKSDGEYIVQIAGAKRSTVLTYCCKNDLWIDEEYQEPYPVVRWMPLPQPPKGE